VTLERVAQAVLERGKSEAEQIIAQAREEKERMLSEARAEGEANIKAAEAQAHVEAERKKVQEIARAELEARKISLAAQKEALDEVYKQALAKLRELKENNELLKNLLKVNESEWKSGGRVYSNKKDENAVKKIVGSAYAGQIDCAGGIVIESADGTRRIDLRYESLLSEVWDDAVKDVAEVLWPQKTSKA
jgi:V/A-type H+/Na+-transporting ATPase subunit E